MSLSDQFTLANNPDFRNKVRTATIIAANQNAASEGAQGYIYTYSNQIISNPNGGWIDSMTFQVVANPAINEGSSDSDIQFTVNSNYDKCAKAFIGVIPSEPIEEPQAP